MKIQFNDLSKQWKLIKDDIAPKFESLFQKSDFIGGKAIQEFEDAFASYCGTKSAAGVSNGTDALKISLKALDLKSPCGVIIPANTFIATILAVTYLPELNYEIRLVDCNEYYQIDIELLEKELKENRKKWKNCVIIPVHLFGHPANIERVMELARQFDCYVLEDSSQSHGAVVSGNKVGSFAAISAFSLYPGKNLGAAGDAGIITMKKEKLKVKVDSLRNYGSRKKYYYDYKGWNNRLDTIQAIILNEKLKHLEDWNNKRIEVAKKYDRKLESNKNIITPKTAPYADKNVYHLYVIRVKERDKLQEYLTQFEIPTGIHYPIAIEETKPFKHLAKFNNEKTRKYSREMLSLPMHPFLSDHEINFITSKVNEFYN